MIINIKLMLVSLDMMNYLQLQQSNTYH